MSNEFFRHCDVGMDRSEHSKETVGVRDEPAPVLDLVAHDLRRRLAQFGWRGQQLVETPYIFTNGRLSIRGSSAQHGKKLRIDALLPSILDKAFKGEL